MTGCSDVTSAKSFVLGTVLHRRRPPKNCFRCRIRIPIDLAELFTLDDDAFRQRFRATPLWRPRRRGLLRNAAICLGNSRSAAATSALSRGLQDSEELVRGASAWALGQIGGAEAVSLLRERWTTETHDAVRNEIRDALERLRNPCNRLLAAVQPLVVAQRGSRLSRGERPDDSFMI